MAQPRQQRTWRLRMPPLLPLLVWTVAAYGVVFCALAFRRYVCVSSGQCWVNAWERFESGVLFLWVDDRETIFGALIALGAAVLAAYYLNRQIKAERDTRQAADDAEQERLQRRFRAVRAVTPLALSVVCDHAQSCANAWQAKAAFDDMGQPAARADVTFPTLPYKVVTDLQAMVEAATEEEARPYIVLLEKLQVLSARTRDDLGMDGNSETLEWADIYLLASSLFDHARVHSKGWPRPTRVQVRGALTLFGMDDLTHQDLYRRIDGLYPAP